MTSRRVPDGLATAGAIVALGAPTALAFFSGGYFDQPRLWAAIVFWVVASTLIVTAPGAIPRTGPARLALVGLGALAALTALSLIWAPLAGPAQDDYQRLALYVAALYVGTQAFRGSRVKAVEPALAFGISCVMAYALSERLLPGLVDLSASASARGRLEQPLTYWNAMGSLGAMGLVLCARICGDRTRSTYLRIPACAVMPLLGLGTWLTLSRGALMALGVGLLVLALLVPDRRELRPAAAGLVAAGAAALLSELGPFRSLGNPATPNGTEGAVMLAALALLGAVCAWAAWRLASSRPGHDDRAPTRFNGSLAGVLGMGTLVIVIGAALLTASGGERRDVTVSNTQGSQRLRSIDTNRYSYWRVALDSFASAPVLGHGSGSFRVAWLRERTINDRVVDAHSLPLQTASELGLAGLAALGAFLAGVAWAGRRAWKADRALACGPLAVLTAYLAHSAIEWTWQIPAVTLVALACAGAVVALAEGRRPPVPSRA